MCQTTDDKMVTVQKEYSKSVSGYIRQDDQVMRIPSKNLIICRREYERAVNYSNDEHKVFSDKQGSIAISEKAFEDLLASCEKIEKVRLNALKEEAAFLKELDKIWPGKTIKDYESVTIVRR